MMKLVVGDKDCSYESVINAVQNSRVYNVPVDEWIKVPKELISEEKSEEIADDVEYRECTVYNAFRKILQEWRQQEQNSATLDKLIQTFEDCEYHDAADELREMFDLPPSTPIKNTEYYTMNLRRLEADIVSYIRNHNGGLSRHTRVTKELMDGLLERDIITQEDVEDNLMQAPNERAKSVRLYNILMDKPTAFNKMIESLEEQKQYEASWILRRFYRYLPSNKEKPSNCKQT